MRKLKIFLIKLIPSQKLRHQVETWSNIHDCGNIIHGRLPKKVFVKIHGDNNHLYFGEDLQSFCGRIYIGSPDSPADNCSFYLGNGSTSEGVDIRLMEDNSRITVGHDCLLSSGITISCSDTHSIIDETGTPVNLGKEIDIGSHVWIGADVKIGKNTRIPDNSVVGWGSVVTRRFAMSGVVIAGNPATIVKENINWSRARPQQLLDKNDRA